MLEEKIKDIIAVYTRLPLSQINAQTVIDRSAMQSSILVHRMYAGLASEGIAIENYWGVKTYGDLLERINGKAGLPSMDMNKAPRLNEEVLYEDSSISVGIDMEEIGSMPEAIDFREDNFYTMNFSSSEIAYCILQTNPLASFAGLFAAKEAIVKADNNFINQTFNSILIDHLPGGKPSHPGFELSISHTTTTAIAIAIKKFGNAKGENINDNSPTNERKTNSIFFVYLLPVIAIIFAIIAIILCLK